MKDLRILFFWLLAFEALAHYVASKSPVNGPRIAVAGCYLMWSGFLLAVSFTEAWVKFTSKLVERQVGLDIGRRVFDALNSLEIAACVTALTILVRHEPYEDSLYALPIVLTIILLLQVLYLTPKLDLRAIHIACDELSKKKHASKKEEEVYKEYKALTTLRPIPSSKLHHLYVLLEVVKVGLLWKASERVLFPA